MILCHNTMLELRQRIHTYIPTVRGYSDKRFVRACYSIEGSIVQECKLGTTSTEILFRNSVTLLNLWTLRTTLLRTVAAFNTYKKTRNGSWIYPDGRVLRFAGKGLDLVFCQELKEFNARLATLYLCTQFYLSKVNNTIISLHYDACKCALTFMRLH